MFEENGYEIVKNLISKDAAAVLTTQFRLMYESNKEDLYSDPQVPNAWTRQDILETDSILLTFKEKIENVTGKKLDPCFSYFRYYTKGDELKRHKDRAACEYSATINLWNESDPWSIFIVDYKGNQVEAILEPGDALVYKGYDLDHWRLPNQVDDVCQVFVHYVDKDGPFSELKYDKKDNAAIWRHWI